jgi:serine/threonine-protein kinase RsbW
MAIEGLRLGPDPVLVPPDDQATTFTARAKLDALASISDYVAQIGRLAGLEEQASYRLRLAVHEIAANVIIHGYAGQNSSGCLDFTAAIDDESVCICLEDTAVPFDPRQAPPPADLDKPLCERQVGGLGIFLARRSVDQWHYEYSDNRNRNLFIMKR